MFSGAPFSGAPFSAVQRFVTSGGITGTARVAGGGAISFTATRQLVAGVSLAGGGALAASLARALVVGAAVAGGGATGGQMVRGLVTSVAVAGGGTIGGTVGGQPLMITFTIGSADTILRIGAENRTSIARM